jgi:hypothetical protein
VNGKTPRFLRTLLPSFTEYDLVYLIVFFVLMNFFYPFGSDFLATFEFLFASAIASVALLALSLRYALHPGTLPEALRRPVVLGIALPYGLLGLFCGLELAREAGWSGSTLFEKASFVLAVFLVLRSALVLAAPSLGFDMGTLFVPGDARRRALALGVLALIGLFVVSLLQDQGDWYVTATFVLGLHGIVSGVQNEWLDRPPDLAELARRSRAGGGPETEARDPVSRLVAGAARRLRRAVRDAERSSTIDESRDRED